MLPNLSKLFLHKCQPVGRVDPNFRNNADESLSLLRLGVGAPDSNTYERLFSEISSGFDMSNPAERFQIERRIFQEFKDVAFRYPESIQDALLEEAKRRLAIVFRNIDDYLEQAPTGDSKLFQRLTEDLIESIFNAYDFLSIGSIGSTVPRDNLVRSKLILDAWLGRLCTLFEHIKNAVVYKPSDNPKKLVYGFKGDDDEAMDVVAGKWPAIVADMYRKHNAILAQKLGYHWDLSSDPAVENAGQQFLGLIEALEELLNMKYNDEYSIPPAELRIAAGGFQIRSQRLYEELERNGSLPGALMLVDWLAHFVEIIGNQWPRFADAFGVFSEGGGNMSPKSKRRRISSKAALRNGVISVRMCLV